MRVVIAAVSSNTHMSGVSRHAANIVRCLLTRSEVSSVHLLVAPWEYEHVCEAVSRKDSRLRVHSVSIRPGALSRSLWYYCSLPGIAAQLEADIVHIAYPSPVQRDAFHCPTVVSLHDLYPYDIPANFGFPKVFFNRMVLQECLRSVNAIACVSESTRQHLGLRVPRAGLNQPVTVTIYNSVEPAPCGSRPPFVECWNGEPFFLCVAQHRRNKNILLVLQVFKRLLLMGVIDSKTRLLIVGMHGPETSHIKRYIRGADLRGVALISGISDAEMHWCYRNCDVLLAPSLVEGFGLPVAEALLAGCRVVCSDIPPFHEVGGHHCRYVALGATAVEDFVRATCEALRERRPLPPVLSQLSSSVIAEQYLRLYLLMIATSKAQSVALASRRAGVDGQQFLGITRPTGPDR